MDVLKLFFNFRLIWEWRQEILHGFWVTVSLTCVTFVVSIVPAVLVAVLRLYGPKPVKALLLAFVSLVRAIPAVVLIVFIFFALPFAGILLSSFTSVVATLTAVQVVYFSEVFRGALLSVSKGQFEAAYSCGLDTREVYRRVVLPQAFAVAAPAFASSVVQLVQNSTVASVTAIRDIVGVSLNIQASTGSPSPWVPTTLLFLLLLLPLVRVVRRREGQMAQSRKA